jgi:hypothetical protein
MEIDEIVKMLMVKRDDARRWINLSDPSNDYSGKELDLYAYNERVKLIDELLQEVINPIVKEA